MNKFSWLKATSIEEALNNAQTVKQKWEAVKKYWPYMSKKTKITKINEESDPEKMANILNTFFGEIGPKLASKIQPNNVNLISLEQKPPVFEFRELALIDVVNIIRDFKLSNSSGIDGITSRILKAAGPTIYPVLLQLVNSSICQKTFLDCWKIGCVTPLYKEGDRSNPSNYRPISVLPCIGKSWSVSSTTNCMIIVPVTIFSVKANRGSGGVTP